MREELLSPHSADRYSITSTVDDLMGTVETLGTKEATLACRMVPVSAADRQRYGITDDAYIYRACFPSNPGLSDSKLLVWDSKVWRVRQVIDSGGVGFIWVAIIEHVPQMELSAP